MRNPTCVMEVLQPAKNISCNKLHNLDGQLVADVST